MREAYIPYTKLVQLGGDLNAVEVTLTDSAGEAFECNYIQVAAAASSVDGYFFVTPDIRSTKEYANQPTAATIQENSASGVVGIVANRETGVATLSLSEKTSKIKISHNTLDDTMYSVTYGNVKLANTLRDNLSSRGN